MTNTHMLRGRGLRGAAASVAAVAALSGLAACSESAGPEAGVTTEELQSIEEDLGALEERVTGLEGSMEEMDMAADDTVGDSDVFDYESFYADADSLIGETVTVSAAVSEVWTEDGAAFTIGGDSGEPIPVISTNPPADLALEDVVQVTGTVKVIQQDTFEDEFGVTDDIFDDPTTFFEDWDGEVALAATSVEVIDESAEEGDKDA